eukprot:CAMPEP_0181196410 /NCGR_PEP_ID=MMETSP1096-20121128/15451_1 /TAXON_ID=156174 ORGANISM="Chrysochromulina ericina, Strain CCMP281" /NCGR_SAMPLE_ID=MMETSP1096 /ASSEMBLY_ACC=CAM_ASM_000453 /LENGTH=103 /DNA_ID=CAMNT_0023286169 /DNA_START=147 /DNA_END=458 /DNA_ORIENTATION=+
MVDSWYDAGTRLTPEGGDSPTSGEVVAAADTAALPTEADLDNGNFMKWYRYEMDREQFEKENPVDALAKYKGPLLSLVAIGIGFNIIPLVRSVVDLVSGGDGV